MHCSRCSASISDDLNFCSKCGERVKKDDVSESVKARNNALDNLSVVTIAIGAAGMLFLVGLVAVVLDQNVDWRALAAIVGMYLAAWFTIMVRLISQMTKVINANLEDKGADAARYQPPQMHPKTTAQLEEARTTPASVTETTTRNLEKIPAREI